MMTLRKDDSQPNEQKERKRTIKVVLAEWGRFMRIDWLQAGLNYQVPASVAIITPTKCQLTTDCDSLEGFRKVMQKMRSQDYNAYNVARRLYVDEQSHTEIARVLGLDPATIYRRQNNAIRFIDLHWRSQ